LIATEFAVFFFAFFSFGINQEIGQEAEINIHKSKSSSKSKMISRQLGGGNEAYYAYVEEADDEAIKDSALI